MSASLLSPTIFQPNKALADYLLGNGFVDQSSAADAEKGRRTFQHFRTSHQVTVEQGAQITLASYGGIQFSGAQLPERALWFWMDCKRMRQSEVATFQRLTK